MAEKFVGNVFDWSNNFASGSASGNSRGGGAGRIAASISGGNKLSCRCQQ
ncbi:hypothetical protein X742_09980 [Mesorhizobium sp. LNHC232B00]|nr:hypothetical protein X742_09980 [Mesorhizobium sp. LNHC232B00]